MVTNLPARAKALWAKAMTTKDPKEKLELLKQFYSSFPKHKSTERLEMQLKRQMKGLEEEIEKKKKKHGKVINIWSVKKGEELQLAVIGRLEDSIEYFNKLTGKGVDLFETYTKPTIRTIKIDSVLLQGILCPFDKQLSEERQKKIGNLLYNMDLFIVVPPDREHLQYLSDMINWLIQYNIILTFRKKDVEIEQTGTAGIRIVGKSKLCTEDQIRQFLYDYKIINGIIKVSEETTLDDIEAVIFGQISKPALVLCRNSRQETEMRLNFKNITFTTFIFDTHYFLKRVLEILGLIRIYTKGHDSAVAERPVLVRKEANVIEVAKIIHKELAAHFLYAKLWRAGEEIKVGRNFVLNDRDVVEIRSR
jgi:ribosome-interacting GTPase 1